MGLTDDTDPAEDEPVPGQKRRATIQVFQTLSPTGPQKKSRSSFESTRGKTDRSSVQSSSSSRHPRRASLAVSRQCSGLSDTRKSVLMADSRKSASLLDTPSGLSSMVEATRRNSFKPTRSDWYSSSRGVEGVLHGPKNVFSA